MDMELMCSEDLMRWDNTGQEELKPIRSSGFEKTLEIQEASPSTSLPAAELPLTGSSSEMEAASPEKFPSGSRRRDASFQLTSRRIVLSLSYFPTETTRAFWFHTTDIKAQQTLWHYKFMWQVQFIGEWKTSGRASCCFSKNYFIVFLLIIFFLCVFLSRIVAPWNSQAEVPSAEFHHWSHHSQPGISLHLQWPPLTNDL